MTRVVEIRATHEKPGIHRFIFPHRVRLPRYVQVTQGNAGNGLLYVEVAPGANFPPWQARYIGGATTQRPLQAGGKLEIEKGRFYEWAGGDIHWEDVTSTMAITVRIAGRDDTLPTAVTALVEIVE